MKITILAYGSHGDVQPFVSLALGLREAGHEPKVAAPENFRGFIEGFGIPYSPLVGDTQAFLDTSNGQDWLSKTSMRKSLKEMKRAAALLRDDLNRDTRAACEGADAIIATTLTLKHGYCLSQKLGVPLMVGMVYPVFPASNDYANVFLSPKRLPFKPLNLLTHKLVEMAIWKDLKPDITAWCEELGLPRPTRTIFAEIKKRKIPFLHLYSEKLFPKPRDWGKENVLTGSLNPPAPSERDRERMKPTEAFKAWLAEGPAPIFIGFGSMPVADPARVTAIVAEVAESLQQRMVIGAGWSKMKEGRLSDWVYGVGPVEYSWLFPRCAAVIHHGGAGTVAASTRAGVPTGILSFIVDQPFWGQQMKKLGVGDTLPFRELTAKALTRMIRRLQRSGAKERSARLGEELRQEDGLKNAIRAVEEHFGTELNRSGI